MIEIRPGVFQYCTEEEAPEFRKNLIRLMKRVMNKNRTVTIDFDGTIHKYNGWKGLGVLDEPIPGAVEFVNGLYEKYKIVIWTCRLDHRGGVTNWLQKHGFKYDELLTEEKSTPKIKALAYVDDRAVSCRPQENVNAYADALVQIERLNKLKNDKKAKQ